MTRKEETLVRALVVSIRGGNKREIELNTLSLEFLLGIRGSITTVRTNDQR